MKLTNGLGVDIVFESVGEKTWDTTLSIIRPLGRIVIVGTTSGNIVKQDLSDFSDGKLKPIIDKVFPLKEVIEAQRRMINREHIGKIILEI